MQPNLIIVPLIIIAIVFGGMLGYAIGRGWGDDPPNRADPCAMPTDHPDPVGWKLYC